jgi:hypothetical protein
VPQLFPKLRVKLIQLANPSEPLDERERKALREMAVTALPWLAFV